MVDQMGGWSNRKKTFTVGGTLGAIASLVTIVSFLTGHSGTPAPGPTPSPAGYSVSPTAPAPPTTTSSEYPASAQSTILSDCQQNSGGSVSYCQCDLNWLELNIPYATFEAAPATFEAQADSYVSCG